MTKNLMRLLSAGALCAGALMMNSCGTMASADGVKIISKTRIDEAVGKVYPALVMVQVVAKNPQNGRFVRGAGVGSGTIIHPDGYILTNYHVTTRPEKLRVLMTNNQELDAELIGFDVMTDLAIIKIDMSKVKDADKIAIPSFTDSSKLSVGEPVIALGCPAALTHSATFGYISNMRMLPPGGLKGGLKLAGQSVSELVRWIGHDAVIFGGNSGGPLLNLKGELVGINEVGIGSLGGAIPANVAKRVADELIERGYIRRNYTGMVFAPLLKSQRQAGGVFVDWVAEKSPAAEAGVEPGDVVVAVNGEKVDVLYAEQIQEFNHLVYSQEPGKEVIFSVRKANGEVKEIAIVGLDRGLRQNWGKVFNKTGLSLREMSVVEKGDRSIKPGDNAIFIETLRASSPLLRCDFPLKPGDRLLKVGKTTIDSIDTFAKVLEQLENDNTELVSFEIERGGVNFIAPVEINNKDEKKPRFNPSKPMLGAVTQVYTERLAKALERPLRKGFYVAKVSKDSPAEKMGMLVGDVITAINGFKLKADDPGDAKELTNLLQEFSPEDEIEITVLRGQANVNLEGELGSRPDNSKAAKKKFEEHELEVRDQLNKEKGKGVVVTELAQGSALSMAGLRKDDKVLTLNGKAVEDINQFAQLLQGESTTQFLVFKLKRGKRIVFVELEK